MLFDAWRKKREALGGFVEPDEYHQLLEEAFEKESAGLLAAVADAMSGSSERAQA